MNNFFQKHKALIVILTAVIGIYANTLFYNYANVLFYVLTCGLIFVILSKLFTAQTKEIKYYLTFPFIATMLFAVLPAHSDVVASIKGRYEFLSLLGALGALYFSLRYVENPKKITLVWIFLSFLFGLFSKENALMFLVIIPITIYVFLPVGTRSTRLYIPIMATLGIALILFLIVPYNAWGSWIGDSYNNEILNDSHRLATPIQRLTTVLYTGLIYCIILLIAYVFTAKLIPFFESRRLKFWLLGALLLIMFHALGLTTLKRNRLRKNNLTSPTTEVKIAQNLEHVQI